jgi:hypothetical protein
MHILENKKTKEHSQKFTLSIKPDWNMAQILEYKTEDMLKNPVEK